MNEKPFSQITHFLGDNEYTLALTWSGVEEWEEKTGRSLFQAFNVMVASKTGFLLDVKELLRIALVGGGMPPSDAFALIKRYVENRPLAETMPVALAAAEAFLFGTEEGE